MQTLASPSAHVDPFCRDNLPPADSWPQLLFDLPELQYPQRLNCAVELLDRTAERFGGDRPCLLSPDGTAWSYDRTIATVNRLAHVLVEAGIVPGNRILLRGPNTPWLAASWLAVLKAGGVAVTTMALLRPAELATLAGITKPDLAICHPRFAADLLAGVPDLPVITDVDQRIAGRSDRFDAVDTAADDVALLASTSGTTGRPKATMHFHRDVLAIADTFARHIIRPQPDDVFTGTPPLAFTFGLGGLLVFPLRTGGASLLVEKATPGELAEVIERCGATVCSTAPTGYRAMLSHADRLGRLRRAISAGEHLPAATWQAFRDATGVRLIDGIGSTEMLHVFISAADDDIRPGSTGRAVPGYVATVLDDAGEPCAPGVAGRLAVRGPTGCRYLADPRQAVYVQHGWNVTGDTFVQDEDGYFTYQARSDDMIISAGYNIAGPEVEEALLQHPAVAECAVVGVPDPERGQRVKAFVVLAGETAEDGLAADLQAFVKQRIAPYKYPRSVEFVTELPRTSTGKVQRYRLRELG